MCSVSWMREGSILRVFMNRDERRTRAAEAPPAETLRDGVRRIAPADGEAGGTWIAVNEYGLVVLVVNGYLRDDCEPMDAPRSRGRLVHDVAAARTSGELRTRLEAHDLRRYRSFRMLGLHPDDTGLLATWDTRSLDVVTDAEPYCPLLSSSHAASAVAAARLDAWSASTAATTRDVDALLAYHAGHAHGVSAYSVCMHRDDAETRSFTRVDVENERVRLAWTPGPPCRRARSVAVELARVNRA
jgi:hypothetical protein